MGKYVALVGIIDLIRRPSFFAILIFLRALFCLVTPAWGAASDPIDLNLPPAPAEGVGQDIKKFGEQVAERIDRIIKTKNFDLWGDPWTLQGLPLIFPTSDNGFNLGLYLSLQDIRRQDPHKVQVEAEILASDQGRYKHFAKLDYPHALDGRFRIITRVAYDREIALPYFGMGNDIQIDRNIVSTTNPIYKSIYAAPSFTLQFLRYFGTQTRIGPVLGFKWADIGAPNGSILQQQQPLGISGGRTHYVGLAIVNDATDFEPYPSRGMANELYLNWYTPALGSNYNFFRGTYFFRNYWPLHRTATLAHRTLFEVLCGDVPFYEMEAVGGMEPTVSFGGDKYIRGFEPNHFLDRIRLVFGFELRWDPISFQFYRQDLTIGFVPFVDVGRVWSGFLPFDVSDFHASTGWGMRIVWSSRLILRADVALNIEGASFIINLGNSF
jgi:hypothetical protein